MDKTSVVLLSLLSELVCNNFKFRCHSDASWQAVLALKVEAERGRKKNRGRGKLPAGPGGLWQRRLGAADRWGPPVSGGGKRRGARGLARPRGRVSWAGAVALRAARV